MNPEYCEECNAKVQPEDGQWVYLCKHCAENATLRTRVAELEQERDAAQVEGKQWADAHDRRYSELELLHAEFEAALKDAATRMRTQIVERVKAKVVDLSRTSIAREQNAEQLSALSELATEIATMELAPEEGD